MNPTSGLNITEALRRLCEVLTRQVPELAHVEMNAVAIRFCQVRRGSPYGIHASLTPLRFVGGALTQLRRGVLWQVTPVVGPRGEPALYLLSFYLPRFCNLDYAEKIATILHELWHIGPQFDGDLRRHAGRCFAHGHSREAYHAEMRAWAARWIAAYPQAEEAEFLRGDFAAMLARYGRVVGTRLPTPRLIRCAAAS